MSTKKCAKDLLCVTMDSPVGELLIGADQQGIRLINFQEGNYPLSFNVRPKAAVTPVLDEARRQLDEYFARRRETFDLPLVPEGTPFQLEAWKALLTIPYGQTVSYGKQARRIGRPNAARAVGAANGRNPIAIVVPCHRVVGSGGQLIGFGGGLANKARLLDFEKGQLTFDTLEPRREPTIARAV